jgi:hypothetical protein
MEFNKPADCPAFSRFTCKTLNILESYSEHFHLNAQLDSDTNDEHISGYLLSNQTCEELTRDALQLYSHGLVHFIHKDLLVKLQVLLFFNIKYATAQSNTVKDAHEIKRFHERHVHGANASILSLCIMTSPKISTHLVHEDLIQQICAFIQIQLATRAYSVPGNWTCTSQTANKNNKANSKTVS